MKPDYADSDDLESIGHTLGFIGPFLVIILAVAVGIFSLGGLFF